jgi:hypothetical protein
MCHVTPAILAVLAVRLAAQEPASHAAGDTIRIRIAPRGAAPCAEIAASRPCVTLAHWKCLVDDQEYGSRSLLEEARRRAAQHKKTAEALDDADANNPQVPTMLAARIEADRAAPFLAVQHVMEKLALAGIYRIEHAAPSGPVAAWLPIDDGKPNKASRFVVRATIGTGAASRPASASGPAASTSATEPAASAPAPTRRVGKTNYPDGASFRAGFVKQWNATKAQSRHGIVAILAIDPKIPWGEAIDLLAALGGEKVAPIEFELTRAEGELPEPARR